MLLLPVKKSDTVENKSAETSNQFVCDLCSKVFDRKGPMSNHRILVHTIRTKEMHCDFCEDIFSTKKDLCSHISYRHSEHFIKKEPVEGELKEEKIELNYILDELKNLKLAKDKCKKNIKPKKK